MDGPDRTELIPFSALATTTAAFNGLSSLKHNVGYIAPQTQRQALTSTIRPLLFGIRSLYEPLRDQVLDDDRDRLGHVQFVRLEVNLRARWGFVWRGNAGEVLKTQDG